MGASQEGWDGFIDVQSNMAIGRTTKRTKKKKLCRISGYIGQNKNMMVVRGTKQGL